MIKKVFISHGHNELIKHKLKGFVRDRLHMEPVVLAEQPDDGLTIVEKLEKYGKQCDFALILLTGDDATETGGRRARQNVIHELGYFHGVLGRKRVLLLKEHGVELFSNISGLIYKEFPGEAIESIFEDIRLALETGDFSIHVESVPTKLKVDFGAIFDAATTPKVYKIAEKLIDDLKELANKYSVGEEVIRNIKYFINSEIQDTQEAINSCEQSKKDSMKPGRKDENQALASAFGIMAFSTIIIDARKKKRALEAMLQEIESISVSEVSIKDVISNLEKIARFYLKL